MEEYIKELNNFLGVNEDSEKYNSNIAELLEQAEQKINESKTDSYFDLLITFINILRSIAKSYGINNTNCGLDISCIIKLINDHELNNEIEGL